VASELGVGSEQGVAVASELGVGSEQGVAVASELGVGSEQGVAVASELGVGSEQGVAVASESAGNGAVAQVVLFQRVRVTQNATSTARCAITGTTETSKIAIMIQAS